MRTIGRCSQVPCKPPRPVPSCPIDPRGCACHHSCHPWRLPCGARTLGRSEHGGLHICRFYFPTSFFQGFWRHRSSLPVWEERSGLKDVDDPKETFRCQSFFVPSIPCLYARICWANLSSWTAATCTRDTQSTRHTNNRRGVQVPGCARDNTGAGFRETQT